jgi:hypothetical protein
LKGVPIRNVAALKCGYTVSDQTGPILDFEWDNKSLYNEAYALLLRTFSSRLSPDPVVLVDFEFSARMFLTDIVQKINVLPLQPYKDIHSFFSD